MRIPMTDIPAAGLPLEGSTTVALDTGTTVDALEAAEPVEYRLCVIPEGDYRRVRGSLKAAVEATCSRCAQRFRIAVQREFEVLYRQAPAEAGSGRQELDEDDLSLDYYEGDALDGQRLLAEQVFLALPMKLLCDDDCSGLCPKCGVNLNAETCDCEEQVDPRLSSLAAIRDRL